MFANELKRAFLPQQSRVDHLCVESHMIHLFASLALLALRELSTNVAKKILAAPTKGGGNCCSLYPCGNWDNPYTP